MWVCGWVGVGRPVLVFVRLSSRARPTADWYYLCCVRCLRSVSVCGDGYVMGMEDCDDGGLVSGDGCSNTCVVESGAFCLPDTGRLSASVCMNGTMSMLETFEVSDLGRLFATVCNFCCGPAPSGVPLVARACFAHLPFPGFPGAGFV